MQSTADEEVVELLRRYAGFLADSTVSDPVRSAAAARWERWLRAELERMRGAGASGATMKSRLTPRRRRRAEPPG